MKAPASRQQVPARPPAHPQLAFRPGPASAVTPSRVFAAHPPNEGAAGIRMFCPPPAAATQQSHTCNTHSPHCTPTLPAPQLGCSETQRANGLSSSLARSIHLQRLLLASVPRPAQRRPSSTAALIPSSASRPDARWLFLFLFSASFLLFLAFANSLSLPASVVAAR